MSYRDIMHHVRPASAPQERVCGKPQPALTLGWGRKPSLSLSLVEAMPCRGNVRRKAHIVGKFEGFGKLRGIGEGRALPARPVNDGKNSDIMSLL